MQVATFRIVLCGVKCICILPIHRMQWVVGLELGPEAAYRFGRGEEVVSSTGQPVRLSRPLDWLAIADHSDAMGVVAEMIAGNPELMQDPVLRRWNGMFNAGQDQAMAAVMEMITVQGKGQVPKR